VSVICRIHLFSEFYRDPHLLDTSFWPTSDVKRSTPTGGRFITCYPDLQSHRTCRFNS